MKTIRWSRPARRDLTAIDDFYRAHDPAFANRVGDQALLAAQRLLDHPQIGPMIGHGPKRKWRIRSTPLNLIYRVGKNGEIEIVRVLDDRRDWSSYFE